MEKSDLAIILLFVGWEIIVLGLCAIYSLISDHFASKSLSMAQPTGSGWLWRVVTPLSLIFTFWLLSQVSPQAVIYGILAYALIIFVMIMRCRQRASTTI